MQSEQNPDTDAAPAEKVLLASIGGAPAPIIFSIRQNQPDKIVFFASANSRGKINTDVLPALLKEIGHIPDHEFIVTPDEQDVGASTFELLNRMPEALRKLNVKNIPWPNLVDYTGGTKTMSAATVWASSRYPCHFSYIGSLTAESRNKGGLGIVLDGSEKCFIMENPWDKVAFFEARAALHLFNRGQYGNAATLIKSIMERTDDTTTRRFFEVLSDVFQGYHEWDVFHHKGAQAMLGKAHKPLCDLAQTTTSPIGDLREFAEETQGLLEILRGIQPGRPALNKAWDLLANAWRRAELEHKYEDAAARCYSAMEKAARYCLINDYGINPGHAEPERIPDELRAEFVRRHLFKYTDDDGNTSDRVRFGLADAYRLLHVLRNPLGQRYVEREQEIQTNLRARNQAILAHGDMPIGKEQFEKLFSDALYLLNRKREDLTIFPQFATIQ